MKTITATPKLCLAFVLLAGGAVVQAQVQAPIRPRTQAAKLSLRTLTPREGKVIVAAAWERDREAGENPDCSHLVHEVYYLAGYPYAYAPSSTLYAGIGNFVRVTRPQPGDLVVWRGHVGIVMDPREHSFYSSVTSGLRTEYYDAPSWKARGPARFYRYAATKTAFRVSAEERSAKAVHERALQNEQPSFENSPKNLRDSTRSATRSPGYTSSGDTNATEPSSTHAPSTTREGFSD
jgi:NlpC/P60 family